MSERQDRVGVRASAGMRFAFVLLILLLCAVLVGETVLFFSGLWRPFGIALTFVEAGLLLGLLMVVWRTRRRTVPSPAGRM